MLARTAFSLFNIDIPLAKPRTIMSWAILVRKLLMMLSWREALRTARLVPNRAYAQHHESNGVRLEGKKSGEQLDDYKLPPQRLSTITRSVPSREVTRFNAF